MRFSVIIPTCNRNHLLAKCLDGLAAGVQTIGEEYEVIVSDDGKNNEAKGLLAEHYPWAQWVEGPKRGPAANRNCGAKRARGEWVVFLDDDCLPDAQLLLNYNQTVVANPHIRLFEGRISPDRARTRMDEEAPINETGGLLWSCNFMIAKQLFELLGGFNEAFQHAAMEDVDLRRRAQHAYEIRFVASAFVIHPWRRVTQPRLKWNRALLAHKTYIKLQPSDESFRAGRFTKQILTSITRGTMRDIVRFKAAGINYALYFHLFQMRLLAHLVFRR